MNPITENNQVLLDKIEDDSELELSTKDLEEVNGGSSYCLSLYSNFRVSYCLTFTRSRIRNAKDLA